MAFCRREVNISLLIIIFVLGVVCLYLGFGRAGQQLKPGQEIVRADAYSELPNSDVATIVSKVHPVDTITETDSRTMSKPVQTVHTSDAKTVSFEPVDPVRIPAVSPLAREARKILDGNLLPEDAANRKVILNYCEHFRAAFPTRDIDFLRQVFSDDALIIVGHTVKKGNAGPIGSQRVQYYRRSKKQYLEQLEKVFAANKTIDVKFDDFRIMRHPTMAGIYGVTLRQRYVSDRYADEGSLFLLWDFRNPSMPMIHVRTWQHLADGRDEPIGMEDFNLE